MIELFTPQVIGFNCVKQNKFEQYIEKHYLPKNWGVYFNCGTGEIGNQNISCGIEPLNYKKNIEPLLKLDPVFLGSCCGSNPDHTRAVKELLYEVYRN